MLWFTMVCGGTGLMALFVAVDTLVGPALLFKVAARSGLYLFFAGIALLPVHLFAYCFNRPRFLITPAWRHEVGPFIAIWHRLRGR
ncbi:hypothetical protein AB0H83_49395 [Dactylosporangium sp. NPDC050688]|uniref:hypothetical protein n=1 Tax=Dactylosporangium sp. NPDC050688 TaxID=3157217 RepID=UPI00340DA8A5